MMVLNNKIRDLNLFLIDTVQYDVDNPLYWSIKNSITHETPITPSRSIKEEANEILCKQ